MKTKPISKSLKVGDLVSIHRPKTKKERQALPTWVPRMNEYDGLVMKIGFIYGGIIRFKNVDFSFNESWVKKVKATKLKKNSISTWSHMQCGKCHDWWALEDVKEKISVYCPHCGTKNFY